MFLYIKRKIIYPIKPNQILIWFDSNFAYIFWNVNFFCQILRSIVGKLRALKLDRVWRWCIKYHHFSTDHISTLKNNNFWNSGYNNIWFVTEVNTFVFNTFSFWSNNQQKSWKPNGWRQARSFKEIGQSKLGKRTNLISISYQKGN